MRITFVLSFAGLQGGIRVVAMHAERLARRGHRVVVISTPPPMSTRRKLKSLLLGRGWRPDGGPSYFDGMHIEHHVLDRVRPVTDLDVPDADVVIATYYETAYGVQHLSPAKGAKALFIQGYEIEEGKLNPRLDATWRMPMHKIAVSRWLVDLAKEKFGDPVVSHVPNSVDLRQFHAAPRDKNTVPTVGLIYSSCPLKGWDVGLKAVKRVAAAMPSLRLVTFSAERPQRVLGPGLPRYADFHYRPPQDALKALYAQSDVWLSSSTREGFCLPLIEAMACRCPVVSTRSGGPLDIVEDGVNGYLADVGDAAELADRVLRVLRLPQDRWKQMSDAAYHTASRFTWDDATDLFEEALRLAIDRGRRGDLSDCA